MTLKTGIVASLLAFCRLIAAGVIPLDGDSHQSYHQHHHDVPHHVSIASSFMHFHGPVEGPEFEVKVPYVVHHTSEHGDDEADHPEEHGIHHEHGYVLDYVAHPKYEFSYGVKDHHTGDFHGQKETRDGNSVTGEYSVQEPGGSVRVVTYRADKDGFHAVVHTTGHNDHSGASYTAEASHEHQGHHHQDPHEQVQVHEQLQNVQGHGLQEYAAGYGTHEGYN